MDIKDSAIWSEITKIIDGGDKHVETKWGCSLFVGDVEYEVKKLITIDCDRQYDRNYGDDTAIDVMIDLDFYSETLFPNKDNFVVQIRHEVYGEGGGTINYNVDPVVRKYKGALIGSTSHQMTGSTSSNLGDSTEVGFQRISIQLIEPSIEQLRMQTAGGIFRDMTTTEVIQGVLSVMAGSLTLDSTLMLKGVDMVPGNNQERRRHTIIPHGTPLMKVCRWVQDNAGGVYTADIRHYIQNGYWFVYPRYNIDRFDSTPKTLTIINIPAGRLPHIERTFDFDGERLVFIATGKVLQIDRSEEYQLNYGNGIRFAKARDVLDKFRTLDVNKVTVSAENNMSAVTVGKRRSGLNQAPMSEHRFTDNQYREISNLTPRVGTFLQIEWQNANPDLIHPGMPVKYVYTAGDDIKTVFGVVTANDYTVFQDGIGITANRHKCNTAVTIFVGIPEA